MHWETTTSSVTFSLIVLQIILTCWSCCVCSCTLALCCSVWTNMSVAASWKLSFDLGGHLGGVKSTIHVPDTNPWRKEKDLPKQVSSWNNPKQKHNGWVFNLPARTSLMKCLIYTKLDIPIHKKRSRQLDYPYIRSTAQHSDTWGCRCVHALPTPFMLHLCACLSTRVQLCVCSCMSQKVCIIWVTLITI